jgi:hypothetical protein
MSKITQFIGRLSLFYRDENKAARLGAYISGDMALTGSIVCKKNIAGTEPPLGTISNLDLGFAGQVDDILPSRCPMPAVDVIRGTVTEDDTISRLELSCFHFDVIEMRLAVRSGVDSRHFHSSALIVNPPTKNNVYSTLMVVGRDIVKPQHA